MKQPTVITAGLDSPGFSADTTTWLLEIDRSGRLVQTIKQDVGPIYRHQHTTIKSNEIPPVDLEDLLETAERVGFFDLPDQLRANISDQETRHLSVRRGETHKRVSVYGAIFLAKDVSDRRIWNFVELWEQVMGFAVYPDENTLTVEALDRAARWTAEERRREEAQRNAFEAAAWARGEMDVLAIKNGFALCPHCGVRFALYSTMSWDGERHRSCGTWLRLPSCVDGLATRDDFQGLIVRDGKPVRA